MRVIEDPADVARAGDWAIAATKGRWGRVDGLVPDVFERYARVFHPAMREADERDLPLRAPGVSRTGVPVLTRADDVPWREVTWGEVAEANGKTAHAAMEWTSITGRYEYGWNGMQPGLWEEVPVHGTLPTRLVWRLTAILAAFTGTPQRCWCAIWDGYGDLVGLAYDDRLPRLAMRARPMLVTCGPLDALRETSFSDAPSDRFRMPDWMTIEQFRSPSLWWPEDRAWCVATDVDLQTTYVGGSAGCIGRLVDDDQLEAWAVPAHQSLTIDADTINPPPTGDRMKA